MLISDSLPMTGREALRGGRMRALRALTGEANRTSVVIYTLDPRGFSKFGLTADDSQYNLAANQIDARVRERHLRFKASQDGLNYLSAETGGIFLHDTNGLDDALGRVLEDQRGYYLIGYRPDADSVDPPDGRRRFHKITLLVTRPGLSVRSRSGFYATGAGAAETGPAVRRFRRGTLVGYGFYVYGARLDPASRRPRLTTELRLFREGRPVFTGKALPFDAAGQSDLRRLVAGGSFRLGTDLPPGDYVLQIVVTDLLAGESRRTSANWIDFEIVR